MDATDALLNIQADGTVYLSDRVHVPGITQSGDTISASGPLQVSIDLRGLDLDGHSALLSFDLLGFGAQTSHVVVDQVELVREHEPGGEVAGRWIFYNGSYFDGRDTSINARDDQAIAPDKRALLPGQTATFANYTGYSRGINGIMIDIAGMAESAVIDAGDFLFRVGNDGQPEQWLPAPSPLDVQRRRGAGVGGTDRVTIVWDDQAIVGQWLQVVVLANDDTQLRQPDVFYWGNAIGDTGNSLHDASVESGDRAGILDHQRNFLNPAPLSDPYDLNRDRFVDGSDWAIARDHTTDAATGLNLIQARGLTNPLKAMAVDQLLQAQPGQDAAQQTPILPGSLDDLSGTWTDSVRSDRVNLDEHVSKAEQDGSLWEDLARTGTAGDGETRCQKTRKRLNSSSRQPILEVEQALAVLAVEIDATR